MAKSPRTRTALENGIAWCDKNQATAVWRGKKCIVYCACTGETISSGYRKAFLTAVETLREKIDKKKAKKR